jgi:hypothetical protein
MIGNANRCALGGSPGTGRWTPVDLPTNCRGNQIHDWERGDFAVLTCNAQSTEDDVLTFPGKKDL